MKIGIILNGISLKKKLFYTKLLPRLNASFTVEVFETISKNNAFDLAAKALYKKFDLIVAAGGDGTVHQVINGILSESSDDSRVPPLAILPLGSGNDFARSINATSDGEKFMSAINQFNVDLVDVGELICHAEPGESRQQRHYFVNVADVGMGPEVVAKVLASGRPFGSAIAYYGAILKTFFTYRSPMLTARSKDWVWEDRVHTFAIANGKYFGSGLCVAPDALLDDQMFNVFAVGDVSVMDFILQSVPLKRGQKVNHRRVSYFTTKEITLTSERDLVIEGDGEVCGWLPAQIKVSERRLKMLRVG